MYSGTLVEIAARDVLFSTPGHPYTRAMLAAVPALPPAVQPTAAVESAAAAAAGASAPGGCAYRDRCGYALAVCASTIPVLEEAAAGHFIACHRSRELLTMGYLPPPAPAAANGAVGV
jgi:peptide/nickel transport system ATP-binding protein